MKFPIRLIACLMLLTISVSAQTARIDSLTKALAQYEKSRKGEQVELRDSAKVELMQQLAFSKIDYDPEAALKIAREQLALSKQIEYKTGIAQAYDLFGTYFHIKDSLQPALKYLVLALKAGRRPLLAEAATYTSIGSIYARQSNYVEATKYMLKGLALSKKAGNSQQTARVYNNLGALFKVQGKFSESVKYFKLALQEMGDGDKMVKCMIYHNLGDLHGMQGKTDEAIEYLEQSLALAIEMGDIEGQAINYNSLGLAYSDRQDFTKALDCFSRALALNQQVGNKRGVARGYINTGRSRYLNRAYVAGLEDAKKGLPLAHEVQDANLIMNAHELMERIYKDMGNYKLAYENLQQFYRVKDSVFNLEQDEMLSRLRMEYDVKAAKDSLLLIQTKKEMKMQAEHNSQKRTRNFMLLILGLVVVFLIIVIWQRNKIAVIKRQKALEEERNRIGRDLHDNLGAQLSAVRMFVSDIRKKVGESDVSDNIENSIELLDASIGDLRGIMKDMQNQTLVERGYLAATEELINRVNHLHGVKFTLSSHNMEKRPDTEIEHQLYRITQELVNNTLKYAKASEVSIELVRRNNRLVLMYEDNGIGFDPKAQNRGFGLNNIVVRTKSVGGTAEFDSASNAGSRAIIEIPENE